VGVKAVVAQLLVVVGALLFVAGVFLLAGGAWALLAAGVLAAAYGLLLVDVPERPERAAADEPGVTPLGSPGVSRAGR
jgi:hypothetical protein